MSGCAPPLWSLTLGHSNITCLVWNQGRKLKKITGKHFVEITACFKAKFTLTFLSSRVFNLTGTTR